MVELSVLLYFVLLVAHQLGTHYLKRLIAVTGSHY